MRIDFRTTHWTLIQRVGLTAPQAREALDILCRAYWYPLYAFARLNGVDASLAEDRVQGFFVHAIEKSILNRADKARGKFRSFLLTCFKNYLINAHSKATTKQRGGDKQLISLDLQDAETRFQIEPAHGETAERIYDRAWAESLISRALSKLESYYQQRDEADLFAALQHGLPGAIGDQVATWSKQFERSPGAIRVSLARMRKRFRTLLEHEIANTLELDGETVTGQIELEIQALFSALKNS